MYFQAPLFRVRFLCVLKLSRNNTYSIGGIIYCFALHFRQFSHQTEQVRVLKWSCFNRNGKYRCIHAFTVSLFLLLSSLQFIRCSLESIMGTFLSQYCRIESECVICIGAFFYIVAIANSSSLKFVIQIRFTCYGRTIGNEIREVNFAMVCAWQLVSAALKCISVEIRKWRKRKPERPIVWKTCDILMWPYSFSYANKIRWISIVWCLTN